MNIPLLASSLTFTTSVNLAVALEPNVAMLQPTVPVPPTGGVPHVNAGPLFCASETNVVLVGVQASLVALPAAGLPGWARRFAGRSWWLVLPGSMSRPWARKPMQPESSGQGSAARNRGAPQALKIKEQENTRGVCAEVISSRGEAV